MLGCSLVLNKPILNYIRLNCYDDRLQCILLVMFGNHNYTVIRLGPRSAQFAHYNEKSRIDRQRDAQFTHL